MFEETSVLSSRLPDTELGTSQVDTLCSSARRSTRTRFGGVYGARTRTRLTITVTIDGRRGRIKYVRGRKRAVCLKLHFTLEEGGGGRVSNDRTDTNGRTARDSHRCVGSREPAILKRRSATAAVRGLCGIGYEFAFTRSVKFRLRVRSTVVRFRHRLSMRAIDFYFCFFQLLKRAKFKN